MSSQPYTYFTCAAFEGKSGRRAGTARRWADCGAASGTAICIVIVVRNPTVEQHGRIYFHDIGDYLSREDKLEKISGFGSIAGIADAQDWQVIHPDEHGDWLRQRDSAFSEFMSMGGKKSDAATMFTNFSLGVVTNRDAWCYGAGKSKVSANMARMIVFYNSEVKRFSKAYPDLTKEEARGEGGGLYRHRRHAHQLDPCSKTGISQGPALCVRGGRLVPSLYRPFNKQWLYFNRRFNEMVYQMPQRFPDAASKNVGIGVSASQSRGAFSVLITDRVPSLHAVDMVGSQYFPMYLL